MSVWKKVAATGKFAKACVNNALSMYCAGLAISTPVTCFMAGVFCAAAIEIDLSKYKNETKEDDTAEKVTVEIVEETEDGGNTNE